MDIKKTFLKLTEYTIPHGMEYTLKKYLPKDIIEDGCGNYYIRIGESRTIFTSHMDTACGRYEKVNHVFTGPMIHTDGKTVLSGDDKNGMTIMLYMISKKIPGTYYFFQGEESGLVGANAAKQRNRAFFTDNFDRMISFDRRGYDSIITHQLGRRGCTEIFSSALSEEFGYHGMRFKSDSTGIYTDSEVFIRVIPEVTNLSCGYFREHSREEVTNIEFLENLAKVACLIKWEELPIGKMDTEMNKYNDWINSWGWEY
jgi:glycosidase